MRTREARFLPGSLGSFLRLFTLDPRMHPPAYAHARAMLAGVGDVPKDKHAHLFHQCDKIRNNLHFLNGGGVYAREPFARPPPPIPPSTIQQQYSSTQQQQQQQAHQQQQHAQQQQQHQKYPGQGLQRPSNLLPQNLSAQMNVGGINSRPTSLLPATQNAQYPQYSNAPPPNPLNNTTLPLRPSATNPRASEPRPYMYPSNPAVTNYGVQEHPTPVPNRQAAVSATFDHQSLVHSVLYTENEGIYVSTMTADSEAVWCGGTSSTTTVVFTRNNRLSMTNWKPPAPYDAQVAEPPHPDYVIPKLAIANPTTSTPT